MSERIRVITEDQYKEYMKLKNQFVDSTKKVRWKPEIDETYWTILPSMQIDSDYWDGARLDNKRYKFGNVFKTEEEAQKELDRRLAAQELLDLADYDEKEREGWIIVFDFDLKFVPSNFSHRYACFPRFASEESCQQAINKLGEEKLKLIFRID